MRLHSAKPRILVVTEKPGWVLNRVASELKGEETSSFKFYFVWGIRRKLIGILMKLLRLEFFDIVYFFPYYLFDRNMAKCGKVSISHLTHLELDNTFKNRMWFQALRNSDHFTAVSKFTLEQVISSKIGAPNIEVIPYGLSSTYQPNFHILLSGNLGKRKGEDFFLQVRELCDRKKLDISWKATKVNEWNLDYFEFDHSNLVVPYSWANLLLVTSELEGGHIGTVEALAMSLPVLTRPVGWAKNELKELVNIAETPLEMFQFIESMYKKWRIELENYLSLKRTFSYEVFRLKHSVLFEDLVNSKI